MDAIQHAVQAEAHSTPPALKITARSVNVYYGEKRALEDVSIDIGQNRITAFIAGDRSAH